MVLMPGVAPAPNLEQPEVFNRVVIQFLLEALSAERNQVQFDSQ
jgi:pimeloyl-ACP methyl ester carboxylesterase